MSFYFLSFIIYFQAFSVNLPQSVSNYSCVENLQSKVECRYKGKTGLELFEKTRSVYIQRKPYYENQSSRSGSIFLVSPAYSKVIGDHFYCWGSFNGDTHEVHLLCSDKEENIQKVPATILKI